MHIGQFKAVRKITFLATPIVNPSASTRGHAFQMQSLEIACEKDILKISLGFFIFSRKQKWQTCKVSGFLYPYRVALSWNLISC